MQYEHVICASLCLLFLSTCTTGRWLCPTLQLHVFHLLLETFARLLRVELALTRFRRHRAQKSGPLRLPDGLAAAVHFGQAVAHAEATLTVRALLIDQRHLGATAGRMAAGVVQLSHGIQYGVQLLADDGRRNGLQHGERVIGAEIDSLNARSLRDDAGK